MYHIAHYTFKLNGVITEFSDIYAPLAQVWKWDNNKLTVDEDSSD